MAEFVQTQKADSGWEKGRSMILAAAATERGRDGNTKSNLLDLYSATQVTKGV